jgi:putative ABC transport system permease protein
MLKNYLKVGLRNLLKHKSYTFINVAGLTVGMACCALLLLYIRDELSYDRFNRNAANIYRLVITTHEENGERKMSYAAAPMASTFAETYPEILRAVRVQPPYSKTLVVYEDKKFYDQGLYLIDDTVLDVFDFPLLYGNPATALKDPASVVLSQTAAKKYFGDENPLGKTMHIERGGQSFQVTGVLKEIPLTSSLRPDLIIPFVNVGEQALGAWMWFGFPSYLLLAENTDVADLESKFPTLIAEKYADAPPHFPKISLALQPLVDVHLHSEFDNESGRLSAMTYLYLFTILALFIIGVACVNFMNLATARSQHRAREVGIRKAVGSRRSMLVGQFMCESILLSFIAVLAAVFLVEFSLPVFNELAQKNIRIDYSTDWVFAAGFVLLAIVVGIVSGSYPALFLSRFQPVEVLKGGSQKGTAGARLRQALVVVQFAISIALIACTLIVSNQIRFIRNKRLGFDREQVLVVPLRGEHARNGWPRLKTELLRHSEISEVSASSSIPADPEWWRTGAKQSIDSDEKIIFTFQIDYDFFEALGIELQAGRFLSPEFPSDSSGAFVINEAAVKGFGWASPEAAIGQSMLWLGHGPDTPKKGTIVGVVKDFHFRPLYEEVGPAVFHLMPDWMNFAIVRVHPNSMEGALATLEAEWSAFDPEHPLEFSFMDRKVEAQYGAESRLLKIFGIFSAFAIFISCLGLLGLASFATEQRTKEIGLRKVLGASVQNLILLLTGGFTRLVLLSFLISIPVIWLAMDKWLQNFAYRTGINLSVFVLAGGLALLVAILTVSTQAIRAATANPVDSLRYE